MSVLALVKFAHARSSLGLDHLDLRAYKLKEGYLFPMTAGGDANKGRTYLSGVYNANWNESIDFETVDIHSDLEKAVKWEICPTGVENADIQQLLTELATSHEILLKLVDCNEVGYKYEATLRAWKKYHHEISTAYHSTLKLTEDNQM